MRVGQWTASAKRNILGSWKKKRDWAVGEDDDELVDAPLVAIMMMTMTNIMKMR